MSSGLHSFELAAADGKLIRGDRSIGKDRQILFITGFLSKRWGNKSKALAQWCEEKGWGFCCYDVRGFGDSDGTVHRLHACPIGLPMRGSCWTLQEGRYLTRPPQAPQEAPFTRSPSWAIRSVAGSPGSWRRSIRAVEQLVLIAPAFNMMGVRAKSIRS